MTSFHLLIGSGGEVGKEIAKKLIASGEQVLVTSHRQKALRGSADSGEPLTLHWDFNAPRDHLSYLDQALGASFLRSVSIFSHPPFLREKNGKSDQFRSLSTLDSFAFLLTHLAPHFKPDSSLLFFFPSLSHHKADSYLFARSWIGAFRGFFEEWSRSHREGLVMGIEILVNPDPKTPHLSPEMIQRISDRTSRGRLAKASEIADFATYAILSGNPLFHGQILRTEGGPYY
jgi:hypothetical protein